MKIKARRLNSAKAPIKTQADLDDIMASVEYDAWYICFGGAIAVFEENVVFNTYRAEKNLAKLIDAISKTYKEAKNVKDKEEAARILANMSMMPMRIH
jgi:hypothetical protein